MDKYEKAIKHFQKEVDRHKQRIEDYESAEDNEFKAALPIMRILLNHEQCALEALCSLRDTNLTPSEVAELLAAKADGRLVMPKYAVDQEVWFCQGSTGLRRGTVLRRFIADGVWRGEERQDITYHIVCTESKNLYGSILEKNVYPTEESARAASE